MVLQQVIAGTTSNPKKSVILIMIFFFFALSLAGLEFDTYIHTGEHKVAK